MLVRVSLGPGHLRRTLVDALAGSPQSASSEWDETAGSGVTLDVRAPPRTRCRTLAAVLVWPSVVAVRLECVEIGLAATPAAIVAVPPPDKSRHAGGQVLWNAREYDALQVLAGSGRVRLREHRRSVVVGTSGRVVVRDHIRAAHRGQGRAFSAARGVARGVAPGSSHQNPQKHSRVSYHRLSLSPALGVPALAARPSLKRGSSDRRSPRAAALGHRTTLRGSERPVPDRRGAPGR